MAAALKPVLSLVHDSPPERAREPVLRPWTPSSQPGSPSLCVVGECVDDEHPTIPGRVLVSWQATDRQRERAWCPTLQHLAIRRADHVLLSRPSNLARWIVVGVIDGLMERNVPRRAGASLQLKADESIVVADATGAKFVELRQGAGGPVVSLCNDDLELELPGRLGIRARELSLAATKGEMCLEASDDVVVRGEMVKLN